MIWGIELMESNFHHKPSMSNFFTRRARRKECSPQLPTLNHQPSTINHQPSTINSPVGHDVRSAPRPTGPAPRSAPSSPTISDRLLDSGDDVRRRSCIRAEPNAAEDCRTPRPFAQDRCPGRCASLWSAPVLWRFPEFISLTPVLFRALDTPGIGFHHKPGISNFFICPLPKS